MTLRRLWKKQIVLRTRKPVFQYERVHKGRLGLVGHTRAVNYYVFNNGGKLGPKFVIYGDKMNDGRDKGIESKAKKIIKFLEENKDKAFYSTEIVKALKVKPCDIMPNVRR